LAEPIKYRVITKWYEFDGIKNQKIIKTIYAYCEKAQAGEVFYQVNDEYKWVAFGSVTKFLNRFDKLNIKFNRIRFKYSGVITTESAVFLGLELAEGLNEGMVV
jgi:hypothetical protein